MSLEAADVREYDRLIARHEERITKLAAHIAEYAGYLAARPGEDQWAQVIENDVLELRRLTKAVDGLKEIRHIFHPQS